MGTTAGDDHICGDCEVAASDAGLAWISFVYSLGLGSCLDKDRSGELSLALAWTGKAPVDEYSEDIVETVTRCWRERRDGAQSNRAVVMSTDDECLLTHYDFVLA